MKTLVRKLGVVINNQSLPVLKKKITLYNTTIDYGRNFDINLPAGTTIYIKLNNKSGTNSYLSSEQRDSTDNKLGTIIIPQQCTPGEYSYESVILENCAKINITIDSNKKFDVEIYYYD